MYGDWLPRTILGKLWAMCAFLRMIYVAFVMLWYHYRRDAFDAIFIDQVSIPIPLLRLSRAKVTHHVARECRPLHASLIYIDIGSDRSCSTATSLIRDRKSTRLNSSH